MHYLLIQSPPLVMNTLVHKSISIRPEVWKRLRINAELSNVSVRDYLSFLIEQSEPVPEKDTTARGVLDQAAENNRRARNHAASSS